MGCSAGLRDIVGYTLFCYCLPAVCQRGPSLVVPLEKCNFRIAESIGILDFLDLLVLSSFLGLWLSHQKILGSALLVCALETELWSLSGLPDHCCPVQLRNELATVSDIQRNDILDAIQYRGELPGRSVRLRFPGAADCPLPPVPRSQSRSIRFRFAHG